MKANWIKLSSFAAGFIPIFFATVIITTASTSPYHIIVNVRTDRPHTSYKDGKKATFQISLREDVRGVG
jgi:hypothetical protein